ncbi:response regulator transcription factor [Actinoplanes awajinensis]|uniref:Two-component system response regulator n=1 Tax=Actinoplanes awajinensis subsp. mycoplanecinus TaxID=135947 RepID=A0A0X3V7L6_9ACTN|nr:response regulator transcription factor [Actinoplanes awajinensis]KUL40781.1 two-component system response regulator [Actinoplanes awajinensis subsp. mycoplanecinus]
MSVSPRVLVVDDQPNIVDLLDTVLRFHGFRVDTATTAAQAVAVAAARPPDLVLLDVMLPDGDGLAVCRRLRADGLDAGIIFLTARDARADQLSGLAYGGDDYVTKPFDVEVLLARVRAVLRRVRGPAAPDPVLRYADLELDQETLQVRRAGTEVPLSPTELKLLRYFLTHSGRVLSRAQILAAVWEFDSPAVSNVVDTYVGYLRRKLDRHGPPLIVTHRGFGYALRAAAP